MKNSYHMPCNIAQTLNIIGDKWSLLILYQLLTGHNTYGDILEQLDGIPTNLLSERLKTLEREGLLVSSLYQEHPPRYWYALTVAGLDLSDVFNGLVIWGEKHLKPCYRQLVHSQCGHGIIHSYYCPTCHMAVDKSEIIAAEVSYSDL